MSLSTDPGFLITFLREPLYLLPDTDHISYLGENKANMLIVVDVSATDFFKTEDYHLLEKILAAVKYSLHEVAVLNLHEGRVSWTKVQAELAPVRAILFGTASWVQRTADYQISTLDGVPCLCADHLTVVAKDRSRKQALWEQLQVLMQA